MRVRRGRIFWGVLILLVAAALIGQLCGLFEWSEINWSNMWPSIPAAFGLAAILSGSIHFWSVLLTAGSVWWLLCNYELLPMEQAGRIGLTAALVLAGLWLIWTAFFPRGRTVAFAGTTPYTAPDKTVRTESSAYQSTSFNSVCYVCTQTPFVHGRFGVSFGSICVDMRSVVPGDNALLEVSCNFGSVHVLVPPGCRVKTEGSSTFGQVRLSDGIPNDPSLPLLTIRHAASFGDIEIR